VIDPVVDGVVTLGVNSPAQVCVNITMLSDLQTSLVSASGVAVGTIQFVCHAFEEESFAGANITYRITVSSSQDAESLVHVMSHTQPEDFAALFLSAIPGVGEVQMEIPKIIIVSMATTSTSPGLEESETCKDVPIIFGGGNQWHCAGMADGGICEAHCGLGYHLASNISCQNGHWSLPSTCVSEGAYLDTVQAMLLEWYIDIDPQMNSSVALDAAWAEANQDIIVDVVAELFGLATSQVEIQVVPTGDVRQQHLAPGRGWLSRVMLVCNDGHSQWSAFLASIRNASVTPENLAEGLAVRTSADDKGLALGEQLASVSVMQGAAPVILNDFSVEVPRWVLGPWGPCDADCGEGEQNRSLSCSSPHPARCDSAVPRPVLSRACESYERCTYDWTCPGGRASPFSCNMQRTSIFGSCSIVIACVLLACFHRNLCAAGGARVDIKHSGHCIQLRFKRFLGHRASKRQVTRRDEDGKLRIIWDIDTPDVVIEVSGDADSSPKITNELETSEPDSIDPGTDDMEWTIDMEEPPRCVDDNVTHTTSFATHMPDAASCKDKEKPESYSCFYKDDHVEYFSKTHKQWLPGIIMQRTLRSSNCRELYDVRIGANGRQVREAVELKLLRRPLAPGEAVEVCADPDVGAWQAAIVSEDQSSVPAVTGYRIRLAHAQDSDAPTSVAAVRLRRRFVAGEYVSVYRGWRRGWKNAIVQDEEQDQHGSLEHRSARLGGGSLTVKWADNLDGRIALIPAHCVARSRKLHAPYRRSLWSRSFDDDSVTWTC